MCQGRFYIQKYKEPHKIPSAAPAATSFGKCTPPATRTYASNSPNTPTAAPIGRQIQKNVIPMTKTENTWRLGNDFPTVSFSINGSMPNDSYGLGAENAFRKKESPKKEAPGTQTQKKSSVNRLLKKRRTNNSGYETNTALVIPLSMARKTARPPLRFRNGADHRSYCSFVISTPPLHCFKKVYHKQRKIVKQPSKRIKRICPPPLQKRGAVAPAFSCLHDSFPFPSN